MNDPNFFSLLCYAKEHASISNRIRKIISTIEIFYSAYYFPDFSKAKGVTALDLFSVFFYALECSQFGRKGIIQILANCQGTKDGKPAKNLRRGSSMMWFWSNPIEHLDLT